jgi:hypothetical protein
MNSGKLKVIDVCYSRYFNRIGSVNQAESDNLETSATTAIIFTGSRKDDR